jgi:hypothetical protein
MEKGRGERGWIESASDSGGRLHSLDERICWGAARLAALGQKVSTSLIERFNLTLRHALAPLTRKCWGFCKDRQQLRRRVVFFQTFYNFVRPHQSLRLPLPAPAQPRTGLIRPNLRPCVFSLARWPGPVVALQFYGCSTPPGPWPWPRLLERSRLPHPDGPAPCSSRHVP